MSRVTIKHGHLNQQSLLWLFYKVDSATKTNLNTKQDLDIKEITTYHHDRNMPWTDLQTLTRVKDSCKQQRSLLLLASPQFVKIIISQKR